MSDSRPPPLSQALAELLAEPGGRFTVNGALLRIEGRGLFLLLILLCLPFITPVPLPGVSVVFGGVIFVLGLRHALGWQTRLPHWLGDRELTALTQRRLLRFSVRFLGWMERVVRPRAGQWLETSFSRWLNGGILGCLGLLLTLPLPVPFTNSLPGYAIILISASLLERDGYLIWIGYGAGLLAVAYIFVVLAGGVHLAELLWRWSQSVPPAGGTP